MHVNVYKNATKCLRQTNNRNYISELFVYEMHRKDTLRYNIIQLLVSVPKTSFQFQDKYAIDSSLDCNIQQWFRFH